MATMEQILRALMQGASVADLEDAGIGSRDILRVALDPKGFQGLQSYMKQAEPYFEYDPGFTYDKRNEANRVKLRYMMTSNQAVKDFANDFWDNVAAAGYDWRSQMGAIIEPSEQANVAAKYGIDPDTFSGLIKQMELDVPEFLTAEVDRQKSQYGEFLKNRKKMGGESGTAALLQAITKAPKTAGEFVENRATAARKAVQEVGGADMFAQAAANKTREALKGVTKKKDFNPVLAYLPFAAKEGF
jgi:hypothetical protein